jgi:hypothetical protein
MRPRVEAVRQLASGQAPDGAAVGNMLTAVDGRAAVKSDLSQLASG